MSEGGPGGYKPITLTGDEFEDDPGADAFIAAVRVAKLKANEPRPENCTCSAPYCAGPGAFHPPIADGASANTINRK